MQTQVHPEEAQVNRAEPNGIRPNRAWVDLFGSAICTFEGGFGGRVALVVTTPELAAAALEHLAALPKFKGRVGLAVLERLHAAPIRHAIRQLEASVVIGLGATGGDMGGVVTRGQKLSAESGPFTASTGLEYIESSDYDGWNAGWLAEKLDGSTAASIVSSVASAQGLATVSCDMPNLERALVAALS